MFSFLQMFFHQEIYKDRQKFSEQVFKVASSDLVNMGISVVSYTLKDIHDDQVKKEHARESHQEGLGHLTVLVCTPF